MASVAAGLGVAVYGFSPSSGNLDFFSSPAHAQVNNAVSKVAQPIGFADIVERVKSSVISVKVTKKNKATDTSSGDDHSSTQPGSPMERFFHQFGGPDGMPPGMRGRHGGHGVMMG
jgi:serine protease Do